MNRSSSAANPQKPQNVHPPPHTMPPKQIYQFTWQQLVEPLENHNVLRAHRSPLHRSSKAAPHTTAMPVFTSMATDTRTLSRQNSKPTKIKANPKNLKNPKRTLFIALDGKTFKGVHFIKQAYTLGVRHIILDAKYLDKPISFQEAETRSKSALPPARSLSRPLEAPAPSPLPHSQNRTKTFPLLRRWLEKHGMYYLAVRETIEAIGLLAQYKLRLLPGFKMALTGSAGKTSTRHFLLKLLETSYRVYNAPKNFNNAIGLPLAIFAIDRSYDFYLFELGMSQSGEMGWLSEMVRPDLSIMTSILPAHFKNFKSLRKIAAAKAEIFSHHQPYKPPHSTPTAVISSPVATAPQEHSRAETIKTAQVKKITKTAEHPNLTAVYNRLRGKVFYPEQICERAYIERQAKHYKLDLNPYNDTLGKIHVTLTDDFELCTSMTHPSVRHAFKLSSCSPFMPQLFALGQAMTHLLGLTPEDLSNVLSTYTGATRRLEEKHKQPKIIDDAYNANPVSMQKVIQFFAPLQKWATVDNLIFVLGDMLELGDKQILFHSQLAHFLNKTLLPQTTVFCYGDLMFHTYQHLTIKDKYHFLTPQVLLETLLKRIHPHDIIIFKGSNGMCLHEVIDPLIEALSSATQNS